MWQVLTCSFFAGVFLTNGVPHFVKGVTGEKFFTPFKRDELSSATTNAIFGTANFIIGGVLLYCGNIQAHLLSASVAFAIAVLLFAVTSSKIFTHRLAQLKK